MIELSMHSYQMIKRLRFVSKNVWFENSHDRRVEPKFRNVIQQTFYYNYKKLSTKLFEHKIINWNHMNMAAGGENIKRYFDQLSGLADLVSGHHQYIED